ncbi:MolR family transcriptional regulator [Streptosporangium carneum]|uniref:MolR family transcriptional regulator n=2 Tax=Streptosporangium carneum TaxID=47481 RepID=A0A9W6I4A7_9ACTN|nr:MolR family transcriptional regulator [Streptosporangium carneum]
MERMLTYVSGSSAKFWQVSQNGTDLNIRYGRLGTAGQTQVKSFDTAAAAEAAADKLAAEKLRKGYVEDDAPAVSVTSPPQATSERVPNASAPAQRPAEVADEDLFMMPASWVRGLHPRRGGVEVTVKRPDAGAPAKVAATLAEYRQAILDSLELCSDPEIVEAGTAHLAGDVTPLGAAVAAEVVGAYVDWQDTTTLPAFADTWLLERGPVFAAVAVAELSSLKCDGDYHNSSTRPALPIQRLGATDHPGRWWGWNRTELFLRVRAAVAATSDAEYAEVVTSLARCREKGPHHRVAVSYLVPTEIDWVEADCAEAAGIGSRLADCLIAAISTPDQVALIASHVSGYRVTQTPALLATLIDGMGAAAVPVLAGWSDDAYSTEERRRLLAAIAELPSDEAMRALIDRIEHKPTQPALLRAAARFPRRAMRMLAASGGKVLDELFRAHVLAHPDLVDEVLAEVGDAAAKRISAISTAAAVATAPPEALPEVLVSPPWKRPRTAGKPVVVSDLVCADEPTLVWGPGERDAWRSARSDQGGYRGRDWKRIAAHIAANLAGTGASRAPWYQEVDLFTLGPEELVRPLLETWVPSDLWGASDWIRVVVARFGPAALPVVVASARKNPGLIAPALLPFAAPEIAVLMAEWLTRLKSVRATALSWLARHPGAAARALVPAALGKPGPARRQAEQALLALVAGGNRDAVAQAAAGYGPAAEAAIAGLLAADPLDVLPGKIPAVPDWADPAILTRVQLRGGAGALPIEAARHVMTMLAISRPGDPYAGISLVKEACDSRSLADFAWALFQRWQAAGYPSKESWMMDALALLGDDETVRRLTPLIRTWPGEGGHSRAVTGLDILAALGSEVALMHLHGIAEKVKFSGLKNRARQKMAEVAAELGLETQELADRLVPDFGLAADGSLTLDYGARKFVVGFDEQLKPYVVDSGGKRLKSLPKPGVKDDAEPASAAYRRFAGLKKDVRTAASDNIRRLEQAMVDRRRWSVEDFTRLFVGHPLLWHIVRRLVWGYYDSSGDLLGALRVAEDRSFADVEDETLTLPGDAVIGVAHPLELAETLSAWAEVFADYEILQPFPQLGREVHTSVEDFDPNLFTKIPTGRVLGLERGAWRRGDPQDAGWQGWIERDLPGGRTFTVSLDPGVSVGYIEMEEEQTLHLSKQDFDGLDPITASEIMRELQELIR